MSDDRVSGVTFIRNNIEGAFCLWESMVSMLFLVDELVVLDLGSTDGTETMLEEFAISNDKIRLVKSEFSQIDAAAFADAANDCVKYASYDTVLFWQADEIWHERLLLKTKKWLENGALPCSFWRYQLKYNFQEMKWFPHPVHRIGKKGDFQFVNDGMNTEGYFGLPVCSDYDMGWFMKWGTMPPLDIPTWDMILDVSLIGAFRDNIVRRRQLHAPMWHEPPTIEDMPADEWYKRACQDKRWTNDMTPFDIPYIMQWHVGKTEYLFRSGNMYETLMGRRDPKEMLGL